MSVRLYKYWRLGIILLLVVGIAAAFLGLRSDLRDGERQVVINGIAAPPVPSLDADRVAEGEALYMQYCAGCHGANLEGEPDWKTPLADGSFLSPPHDSSGHTWHHPDELLIDIVSRGGDPRNNSKMPGFKDQLTEDEIVATLEFIKSRWGREEREFQWWMTTIGSQQ